MNDKYSLHEAVTLYQRYIYDGQSLTGSQCLDLHMFTTDFDKLHIVLNASLP